MVAVATSFKRTYASSVAVSAPDPAAGHSQPTPSLEPRGYSQASLAQSLLASLLLSPGSWCVRFCCALQESVSPVLWKFCNQNFPLAFQVKFPGGSQSLCQIPRLGKLPWLLGIFAAEELLWCNCSPVCGSSARWLYSGANGDLLREDLGHTLHLPGLLQPEPLALCQAIADPCLCRKHSKSGLAQSLLGVTAPFPGSWCTQGFCLCPLSISGRYEVWFWMRLRPSYDLVEASPCPWVQGIIFWWAPTFFCWCLPST